MSSHTVAPIARKGKAKSRHAAHVLVNRIPALFPVFLLLENIDINQRRSLGIRKCVYEFAASIDRATCRVER